MLLLIKRLIRDESGATAIEYSLVAGLMSLVIVAALKSIGSSVNSNLTNAGNGLR